MLELNRVMLVGRLTRDPEYRSTSTGRAVVQMSLAVNRRSQNRESGGYQDEATFIDVETWEQSAEFCKNYLRKGSGIFIEGRLKQDRWQDRETGANRSKIVVVAERIRFAESKAEAERHRSSGAGEAPPEEPPAREASPQGDQPAEAKPADKDDDLPF